MGKRQSKSILDIETTYKEPRRYGYISCLAVLMKRLSYTIDQHNVRVNYNADSCEYMVLWLSLNAEHQWDAVEDLHFFHECSKTLTIPYNKLLEHVKEAAIKQWGSIK